MNRYTGRPDWEPTPYVMAEIDRANQALNRQESRSRGAVILGLCFIVAILYAAAAGFIRSLVAENQRATAAQRSSAPARATPPRSSPHYHAKQR